jgi:hypothetical protein
VLIIKKRATVAKEAKEAKTWFKRVNEAWKTIPKCGERIRARGGRPSRKAHVYVIDPMDRGPVKIGVSSAPERRVRDLQIGHHEVLGILAMFPGGEEDEQELHKIFSAERLQGEWFERTPRVCNFIDMIACEKVAPVMAMAECRSMCGSGRR